MAEIKLTDFKLPELPSSFSNGLELLKEYGESTVEKTREAISGVGDKIRESVGLETSENESGNRSESEGDNRAIDFKSIGGVGDIVAFGGLIQFPGSYTMDYKVPCEQGQYNTEVGNYLNSVREDQRDLSGVFSEIGGFLNFNERENGIFVKRSVNTSCSPEKPKKSGRKTIKIGERCVDDRECIVTDTRNLPLCKKRIRDKYLTGICNEIIRGENDKCEKDDDCASDLLQCVNKKCISRKRRAVSQNNTKKSVNTSIPLESFTGLGR